MYIMKCFTFKWKPFCKSDTGGNTVTETPKVHPLVTISFDSRIQNYVAISYFVYKVDILLQGWRQRKGHMMTTWSEILQGV